MADGLLQVAHDHEWVRAEASFATLTFFLGLASVGGILLFRSSGDGKGQRGLLMIGNRARIALVRN